jgi:hypothetical protein
VCVVAVHWPWSRGIKREVIRSLSRIIVMYNEIVIKKLFIDLL